MRCKLTFKSIRRATTFEIAHGPVDMWAASEPEQPQGLRPMERHHMHPRKLRTKDS